MQEQQSSAAQPSIMSKLMNVFTSPSEAFEGISSSPSKTSSWLYPFIATIVISILGSFLVVTNESLRAQIVDAQEKSLQQMVESKRMTQQQADAQIEGMRGMGVGMFMAFGIVFALVFIALYYFGGSLFLWLTGKFALKSTAGYGKYLEVYGISSWIGVLGGLITTLLIIGMNSLYASPSAALAVFSDYDVTNDMHKYMSAANAFSIWQAAVLGIGLSKLSGKGTGAGVGVAFGLWLVWVVISVSLGIAR